MTNNYASFKIRLLASLLDGVISVLILSVLLFYISTQPTLPQVVSAVFLSLIILFNPLLMFSSVLFPYYFGGSPGKLLTGLRIVSEDDNKLSFKRILFRQTIGYSFSWIFFGLGYFSIIKDPKKQAWHDKTVGSVVKAKGNLFIIGIMIYIICLIGIFSIFAKSINNFAKSPAASEIQTYFKQTESQSDSADKDMYIQNNYMNTVPEL